MFRKVKYTAFTEEDSDDDSSKNNTNKNNLVHVLNSEYEKYDIINTNYVVINFIYNENYPNYNYVNSFYNYLYAKYKDPGKMLLVKQEECKMVSQDVKKIEDVEKNQIFQLYIRGKVIGYISNLEKLEDIIDGFEYQLV